MILIKRKKGQNIAEYSLFIAGIIAALIGLQIYFGRAVKDNLKERSDAIGGQFTTGQTYTVEKQSHTLRSSEQGYVQNTGGDAYWSRSKILADGGVIDAGIAADWHKSLTDPSGAAGEGGALPSLNKLTWTGNEITKTDYVKVEAGDEAIGEHATLDSGVLATINPWDDAGIAKK
ncbi:MAG: hypothetical protein ABH858_02540 [Candidatus Omnitrophota bacterium]